MYERFKRFSRFLRQSYGDAEINGGCLREVPAHVMQLHEVHLPNDEALPRWLG